LSERTHTSDDSIDGQNKCLEENKALANEQSEKVDENENVSMNCPQTEP